MRACWHMCVHACISVCVLHKCTRADCDNVVCAFANGFAKGFVVGCALRTLVFFEVQRASQVSHM